MANEESVVILLITQARLSSTRLPEKVLRKVGGKSLLAIHLERLKSSKTIDRIIVATTHEPGINRLIDIVHANGLVVFQGSLNDVLDRFFQAAIASSPSIVVRVTSDCPLIDPEILDSVVKEFLDGDLDYLSNCHPPTFPDGMDVEIIRFSALERAWNEAQLTSDREHVTPYIWKNSNLYGKSLFKAGNFSAENDLSKFRLTVDTEADLLVIQKIISELGCGLGFRNYVDFLQRNPSIFALNGFSNRNEGFTKSLKNDSVKK